MRHRIIFTALIAVSPLLLLVAMFIGLLVRDSPDNGVSGQPGDRLRYWENRDISRYETKFSIPVTGDYVINVLKRRHVLQLIREGAVIREYRTNVRAELPDRLSESDGQTPEGIFSIWQMAVVSDWNKRWMALDTAWKAREIFINEFASGEEILRADEAEHGMIKNDADIRRFNARHPQAPMLRGFGIHGGGCFPGRDWTLGCPALADEDVIELYDFILKNPNGGIGTLVYIQD